MTHESYIHMIWCFIAFCVVSLAICVWVSRDTLFRRKGFLPPPTNTNPFWAGTRGSIDRWWRNVRK